MEPSVNIVHQWHPQAQEDSNFLGDPQLDFPHDLGDIGLDIDLYLENLGLPPLQTAISDALTEPIIHPTLAPQQTAGLPDRGYAHWHPSESLPTGASAAVINRRDLGLLFGNPDIPTGPIPTTSGVAPVIASTPASLSSLIGANPVPPVFGFPTGAPLQQIVRPWNTPASSSMDRAITAPAPSAYAGPRQAPVFHCTCVQHGDPLVRVHDIVEWVQPGVMKMSVYFNFSPNAAAEAHSSWERRDA